MFPDSDPAPCTQTSSEAREAALLARLEAFELDEPGAQRPFSRRLAEEQGWSHSRTVRAIREYKRFLFLATTMDGGASPSRAVDAVWHLHLLYSRSYWSKLCAEVLGRPLHHEPSRGGASERIAHTAMYARTLAGYRVTFFRGSSVDRRTELGRRSLEASVRAAHAERDELARDPITIPAFLALGVAIDGALSRDLGANDLTRELFLGARDDGGGGCGSSCGSGGCGGGGGGGCGGCGGD